MPPLILVIQVGDDHNGALEGALDQLVDHCNSVEIETMGYHVDTVDQMIEVLTKYKHLHLLYVLAHGSSSHLPGLKPGTDTFDRWSQAVAGALGQKGTIFLHACSTGKGDMSFAQHLANATGHKVMAPTDDVLPNEFNLTWDFRIILIVQGRQPYDIKAFWPRARIPRARIPRMKRPKHDAQPYDDLAYDDLEAMYDRNQAEALADKAKAGPDDDLEAMYDRIQAEAQAKQAQAKQAKQAKAKQAKQAKEQQAKQAQAKQAKQAKAKQAKQAQAKQAKQAKAKAKAKQAKKAKQVRVSILKLAKPDHYFGHVLRPKQR